MVRSTAATVEDYLAELPPARAEVLAAVRQLVLDHLPDGYVETMNWGMISYEIPLEVYPDTYNGQPLGVIAIAGQQRHVSLYLHGAYADEELAARFRQAYEDAGMRLDMGKSCVRFTSMDRLHAAAVADVVAAVPPARLIELHGGVHG